MALALALALSLVLANVAHAHDVWLSPERFALERGDRLVVRQVIGEAALRPADARELPVLAGMTPRFEFITPDESVDLLEEIRGMQPKEPVKPVLRRNVDFDGLALVVMDHDPIYAEQERSEFLHYLEHENFDEADFAAHMGSKSAQMEAYSRSLKSLLQVGSELAGDLHGRVVGQKLEIVLLQNPYQLDPGETLDIRVLLAGKPLPGALVRLYNQDDLHPVATGGHPPATSTLRTDKQGVVHAKLLRPGVWLVRLVHLMPCSDLFGVDCDDADWESYWASYTFLLD